MESSTSPAAAAAARLSPHLFLDRFGKIRITLHSDGLSFERLPNGESHSSFCLCANSNPETETRIQFTDIYAVELISWGSISDRINNSLSGAFLPKRITEMNRFVVHGVIRSEQQPSPLLLSEYTFGHEDSQMCQNWVEYLRERISNEKQRPKNLLIFVHPLCGKGNGNKTWDSVAPIFHRAEVRTKVTFTQRAGHAYDTIASLSDMELRSLDGIIAVGGDGLFNEVLNGLLVPRYKGSYPPTPPEFDYPINGGQTEEKNSLEKGEDCSPSNRGNDQLYDMNMCTDKEPLLPASTSDGLGISKSCSLDESPCISFPNDWFRLGMIPSGSTDAIVLSTTGVRDPLTSALHIILGRKMPLDVAQIVRWKTTPSSSVLPTMRYVASFVGYGFYGSVVQESEKLRWMGPARYDYAGTKVFLEHRSYEAELAYLEDDNEKAEIESKRKRRHEPSDSQARPDRIICRTNCFVCREPMAYSDDSTSELLSSSPNNSGNFKWRKSKGSFLSVGAAIMSCRNERAPDGLVADAHLADGFLHLILVKQCPRPFYLWHLTRLARKGSDPFSFRFVEHHKTKAFTFSASHDNGVWNLDGEIFQASALSAQVCRGLVNLFASGPEI